MPATTHFDPTLASATASSATVRDYIMLLKPRVMTLVVFSGFAGMMAAPGHIHPLLGAMAMLFLCIGAGASGAINMWYDRDIDAIMTRTQNRPIPSGRMVPEEALSFALAMGFFAIMLMGVFVNWVTAAWLFFAMVFYAIFYTMILKRRTPQNIVIGGAAGAFPPVIGWAAVTGDVSHPLPWLFFAIIFLWTPPHFWALALVSCQDYAKANIPMLPNTHGEKNTRWQMLIYTLILWGVSVLPWTMGYLNKTYGIGALVLGGMFTISAIQVLRLKTRKASQLMFGYSILYLFLIFALVIGAQW
ncbi:MAG TPA: heme o synthase [Alphaproteobacteria bacterium]